MKSIFIAAIPLASLYSNRPSVTAGPGAYTTSSNLVESAASVTCSKSDPLPPSNTIGVLTASALASTSSVSSPSPVAMTRVAISK